MDTKRFYQEAPHEPPQLWGGSYRYAPLVSQPNAQKAVRPTSTAVGPRTRKHKKRSGVVPDLSQRKRDIKGTITNEMEKRLFNSTLTVGDQHSSQAGVLLKL